MFAGVWRWYCFGLDLVCFGLRLFSSSWCAGVWLGWLGVVLVW